MDSAEGEHPVGRLIFLYQSGLAFEPRDYVPFCYQPLSGNEERAERNARGGRDHV